MNYRAFQKAKINFLVVIISTAILSILLGFNRGGSDEPKAVIVHEWGTFTTLSASDGKTLSGLFLEEESLPSFVHKHKFQGNVNDRTVRQKGSFVEPENVTVKMETPVIYFYTPEATKVSVRVDFPRGSISQWYPQRSEGDEIPKESYGLVDFKNDFKGWIAWNDLEVLAPDSETALSPQKNEETNTWIRPRETDANKVSFQGEVEKFLFYRGLGNFTIPLKVRFDKEKTLIVENAGKLAIPYVFVYEKTEDGRENVWWTGTLAKAELKKIPLSNNDPDTKSKFKEFEKALVEAGLYDKEAQAMLATWESSYFKKPGFRVFWVLPAETVDAILPLKIMPAPAEIKRVFVGRCDILTPDFEQKIAKAYKENNLVDYRGHRYYFSLAERAAELVK